MVYCVDSGRVTEIIWVVSCSVLFLFCFISVFRWSERGTNVLCLTSSALGLFFAGFDLLLVPQDVWTTLALADLNLANSSTVPDLDPNEILAQSAVGPKTVSQLWRYGYWAKLLLIYLLLPILSEYESATQFSFRAKLRTALWMNAAWYIAYVVIGAVAVGVLLGTGQVVDKNSLTALVVVISNAYSLFLITILMGYGLVAAPFRLWRISEPELQLEKCHLRLKERTDLRRRTLKDLKAAILKARQLLDQLGQADAEEAEEGIVMEGALVPLDREMAQGVQVTKRSLERAIELWTRLKTISSARGAATLQGLGASFHSSGTGTGTFSLEADPESPAAGRDAALLEEGASLAALQDVNAQLRAASLAARQAGCRWRDLRKKQVKLENVIRLAKLHAMGKYANPEAVIASMAPPADSLQVPVQALSSKGERKPPDTPGAKKRDSLQASPDEEGEGGNCITRMACYQKWLVFRVLIIRPAVNKLLSVFAIVMSMAVVSGELTMFSAEKILSPLGYFFWEDQSQLLCKLLCFMCLSYVVITNYWSIFRMRIPGWYGLYADHSTDIVSMITFAKLAPQISPALCYNFLLLINVQHVGQTQFQKFVGERNLKFGQVQVDTIFPFIVVALCALNTFITVCGVCGCLMRCFSRCGMKTVFKDADESDDDVEREGEEPQESGPEEVQLAPLGTSSPGHQTAAEEEEAGVLDASSSPSPGEPVPTETMPVPEGSPASHAEAVPTTTTPVPPGKETVMPHSP